MFFFRYFQVSGCLSEIILIESNTYLYFVGCLMGFKKIIFILVVLAGIILLLFSNNGESYLCPDCNVILITVDTLRADHLGIYGYVRDTSPNMDSFAAENILFNNAFVQWPRTSQSMASMLSSKYPDQNGVRKLRTRLSGGNLVLAEVLRDQGYWCAGFVSNGNLGSEFGFDQGFHEYFELWKGSDNGGRTDSYTGDEINEAVLPWLDLNSGKKFFLMVFYVDPHGPYTPPKPFDEKFAGDDFFDKGKFVSKKKVKHYQRLDGGDKVDVGHYISQYDGEISFVDEKIGELLSKLEGLGLLDNSIVVLTADHGESLDEHGNFFRHGDDLFNSNVRVPLIIHHPKAKQKVVGGPVGLIDIVPTLLDFVGVDASYMAFEGNSLTPLLSGTAAYRPVFSENENYFSVVVGRHKLVRNKKTGKTKLFDYYRDTPELESMSDSGRSNQFEFLIDSWLNHISMQETFEEVDSEVEVDDETLEQLRALGYLD